MLPPVISVRGKPFECGLQYGSQAGELIRKNADVYFTMWEGTWGGKRSEILKKCKDLAPTIGKYSSDILEELAGIARGANLSLEEVIALNARYEINFSLGLAPLCATDGCTSVAALPQVTGNGHTIVGQNWDWLPRFQEFNVILEVEQEGRPRVITQPEAGVLAHRGMNSAGLGACFNGMASSQDTFGDTVPFLIIMRGILNASNYSEALKAVLAARTTLSGNFLIAHRDGEAIDLEVSPEGVKCVYPDKGILAHSNHFVGEGKDFTDMLKPLYPDTLFRPQRARQLLEAETGRIGIDSFQRAFRDHFSFPHSICRHKDERAEGILQWVTLYSTIMDLNEHELYTTKGYPCQSEYLKICGKCGS